MNDQEGGINWPEEVSSDELDTWELSVSPFDDLVSIIVRPKGQDVVTEDIQQETSKGIQQPIYSGQIDEEVKDVCHTVFFPFLYSREENGLSRVIFFFFTFIAFSRRFR